MVDVAKLSDEELIIHFYKARSPEKGTFQNSTDATQKSVSNRFKEELEAALRCSSLLK